VLDFFFHALTDLFCLALLCTGDWSVAETSNWNHNTHETQTSIPPSGF